MRYFTLLSFAFSYFFSPGIRPVIAQSLLDADTLVVAWEQLDGPQGPASQFKENDNFVFAVGLDGLYATSDSGQHWVYNSALGRKKIKYIDARGNNVLVLANDIKVFNQQPGAPPIELFQLYLSKDNGQSWERPDVQLNYDTAWPNSNVTDYGVSDFARKNDSTVAFIYSRSQFPIVTYPEVYISTDNGETWSHQSLPIRHLNAANDTFTGRWFIPETNNYFVSGDNLLNDVSLVNSSNAGIYVTAFTGPQTYFKNGYFYILNGYAKLLRTSNYGVSWEHVYLPIDSFAEYILADSVFYLKSANGVYKGRFDQPDQLFKVYNGEQGWIKRVASFGALPSGLWVNTSNYVTLRSNDNGASWTPAYSGLGGKVDHLFSSCGKLFAYSNAFNYSYNPEDVYHSVFVSDQNKTNWQLIPELTSVVHDFFGQIGTHTYRFIAPNLQRSTDCGATWENTGITSSMYTDKGMQQDGNRIYFYGPGAGIVYSDDDGVNWTHLQITGSDIKIITSGDSIWVSQEYSQTGFRSYDSGQTWTNFSGKTSVSNFWKHNKKLILTAGSNLFIGTIQGGNWTLRFTTSLPFMYNPNLFGGYQLEQEGLILFQANRGLYMTFDEGLHWTRVGNLPFTVKETIYKNGVFSDSISEGAQVYLYHDGYLYAGTHTQGIWRTPFAPLLEHAQGVVPVKVITETPNWLYENPNGNRSGLNARTDQPADWQFEITPNPFDQEIIVRLEIQLPENHTALLRIYNAQGQLVQLENVDTALQPIRTDQLPPGFYVAELILDGQRQVIKTVKL